MSNIAEKSMRGLIMREALALSLFALIGMLVVALYSFDASDASLNQTGYGHMTQNLLGWVGAYVADLMYQLMGWVSWGLIFLGLAWAWRIAWGYHPYSAGWTSVFWFPCMLALMGLLQLHGGESALPAGMGGALGVLMSGALAQSLQPLGADFVLLALLFSSLVIASQISLLMPLRQLVEGVVFRLKRGLPENDQLGGASEKERAMNHIIEPVSEPTMPEMVMSERKEPEVPTVSPLLSSSHDDAEHVWDDRKPVVMQEEAEEIKEPAVKKSMDKIVVPPLHLEPSSEDAVEASVEVRPRIEEKIHHEKVHDDGIGEGFRLPPLELFSINTDKKRSYSHETLEMMGRLLEEKLLDYRVEGKVVAVQPGPVVVQFELELAAGTKSSKVVGLQSDLARSMAAFSVRVVGNIPGKNVIGIELPNEEREMVVLRDVLSSQAFANKKKILPLALGVDIAGQSVVVDLAKMPHLLVAGTTGSGKSVSVNAMICSMLMTHTPESLRLILVDPKMLELSMYDDIPHLLVPVVTSPHKANKALAWAVFEMERRYKMMSEAKVRNLAGYNKAAHEQEDGEILPLIVIVIDELADLMMVAGKEVEQSICRLAQKARAAGLHLILATQRPSVDVITGLIKANLPSRLACKVSSKIDSRTILDQMGAEQLLGMGDSLFLDGGRDLNRVHGAFVSDSEVIDLVAYLKTQGEPDYKDEVFSMALDEVGEEDAMGGMQEERDGKYDEAAALVIEKGKCSVSMVQRYLRIGYNRASRIVEQMERDGLVTPPGAGGNRKVLAKAEGGVFE